jgi:hypothetical protein
MNLNIKKIEKVFYRQIKRIQKQILRNDWLVGGWPKAFKMDRWLFVWGPKSDQTPLSPNIRRAILININTK